MTPTEFVGMVARMDNAKEAMRRMSGEEFASDSTDTVDSLVSKAREIERAERIPTKSFVEDGVSFRAGEIMRHGRAPEPKFDLYPKGGRSHWSKMCTVYRTGSCWVVWASHIDAFPTFAEAKAHALIVAAAVRTARGY